MTLRPAIMTRNFGNLSDFMKYRIWWQLSAWQLQESLLPPKRCFWTPRWHRWKLTFDIFWPILVAMRGVSCELAFGQRKNRIYMPSARKPWLTVYCAHSGKWAVRTAAGTGIAWLVGTVTSGKVQVSQSHPITGAETSRNDGGNYE